MGHQKFKIIYCDKFLPNYIYPIISKYIKKQIKYLQAYRLQCKSAFCSRTCPRSLRKPSTPRWGRTFRTAACHWDNLAAKRTCRRHCHAHSPKRNYQYNRKNIQKTFKNFFQKFYNFKIPKAMYINNSKKIMTI